MGLKSHEICVSRIVKRSVAESVADRASDHTKDAALLKVERLVSDRIFKRSGSSLNTFIDKNVQRNLVFVNDSLLIHVVERNFRPCVRVDHLTLFDMGFF